MSAYTWGIFLASLLLVGFVYSVVEYFWSDMIVPLGESEGINTDENTSATWNTINLVITKFPIIAMLGLIVWAFTYAQRRRYYEQ